MSQVNWSDIKNEFTESILFGNGASIAFSDNFKYNSLFEHAKIKNYLSPEVLEIFGKFDKTDFELILRILWQSMVVNKSLTKQSPNQIEQAYREIRLALINSVRSIHPEYNSITDKLPAAYRFLSQFKTIVSLNYDLLIYWAMMFGNNSDIPPRHVFKDCFVRDGLFCEDWRRFRTPIRGEGSTSLVFYPHGNLILSRNGYEDERKITTNLTADLLRSILNLWENQSIIPNFVSEGTSHQKINSIYRSPYLSKVYNQVLPELGKSLVIYGWGMEDNDSHILKSIARNPSLEKIAVSILDDDEKQQKILLTQSKIHSAGFKKTITFFNPSEKGCWIN